MPVAPTNARDYAKATALAPASAMTVESGRQHVIDDPSLTGGAFGRSLSDASDAWLAALYRDATAGVKNPDDVALLAVGGYGRRELAPYSDLDVLLVHRKVRGVDEIASRIWYPVWDAGLQLGHAVRTPAETVRLCGDDLDTATALVTARWIAGSSTLADEVIADARAAWQQRGRRWLQVLHDKVLVRHVGAGEVAYLLEPDLKQGMGGLRDVHALWWAIAAGLDLAPGDTQMLVDAHEVLFTARVELHRHAGRAEDVLRLDCQSAVASAIGYPSSDALMAAVAHAGRQVAWVADEAWWRLDPPPTTVSGEALAPGISLRGGETVTTGEVDPAADPTFMLRVATAAARTGTRIERRSLDWIADRTPQWPTPWPAGARDDLVALLLEGERAIPVFEALDHRNLLVKMLPEWAPVRSKPQRNAYHRFTVDRHLWQAAANAAALVDRVGRPDLLMLGALFHDIGKGYAGDHSDEGVKLFDVVGRRMGLDDDDVDVVCRLIRHHLLLAEVATQRDLADDATIALVADSVVDAATLSVLHALTEADSLATGASAWSSWKADLIDTLVARVGQVLGGGDVDSTSWRLFPDAEVLEMMAAGELAFRTGPTSLTVVGPDRPGMFSKVAGAMALHSLDVLGAEAHSDEGGVSHRSMAASEFRVAPSESGTGDAVDWSSVIATFCSALEGQIDLDIRLAERARTRRPPRPMRAGARPEVRVTVDNSASSDSTFIGVRAADGVGILYRITTALAGAGLDIRHARVQTIGDEVVDTFYVRGADGGKVVDPEDQQRIVVDIRAALARAVTDVQK